MRIHWDTYLTQLQSANNRLEVWSRYQDYLKQLGFNYFLYADLVNPGDEITVNACHIKDNFPVEWMERYIERDYARSDYFIKHCLNSAQPIIWHSKQAEAQATKTHNNMMLELGEFNLNAGITIP